MPIFLSHVSMLIVFHSTKYFGPSDFDGLVVEDIYDDVNQTFTLIDKFDTRFSLRPREGCRAKGKHKKTVDIISVTQYCKSIKG